MGVRLGMPKPRVGFRAARTRLIEALRSGRFAFEYEDIRSGKNLLQTGDITPEFLIELLLRCNGAQYSDSPHHLDPSVLVHIFKPEAAKVRWYVKCYFLTVDTILISVHMAEY